MLLVRDACAEYGGAHALMGISLDVAERELVVLLGANGAGKSTTLKIIAGLLRPTRGEIEFDGKDITGVQPHRIVKMGIVLVPEERRLFPFCTVLENLELGGYSRHRETRELLKEVFDIFPVLAERKNQLASTLSGGEQQMVAVGRALMSKPKILLLDEPSLGLAPLIVRQIFKVIEAIRQSGTTILLVEQNARLGLAVADRGYVMQTGEIILSDSREKLRCNEMVINAYLGGH